MQTQQIELYIEKIRSGIEVTGMVENEYVELRYKYFLNNRDFTNGMLHSIDVISLARSYGELCNRNIETDHNGNWKSSNRRKVTDEMYSLIGIVETFLNEKGYIIIE